MRSAWRTIAILLSIMLVQSSLLAWSAARHAPTWDEVGHLAAGVSHWTFGDFSQYCVNPPLVRTVATAPLAFWMPPEMDWQGYSDDPRLRTEVQVGRRLIDQNPERFLSFFRIARWTCIPLVLLGSVVCFLWGRELFGDLAGLMAAGTWAFSPMVLGHGSLITPDVAASSLGVSAFYALRCWLRESTWSRVLLMSVLFALALLAKSTWIICLAVVPMVWLAWRLLRREEPRGAPWRVGRDLLQLTASMLLVFTLLNAFYGFEGTFRRLGDYEFVSTRLAGRMIKDRRFDSDNCFRDSWLGRVPVLLPKSFVTGIDVQSHDFERAIRGNGWLSYLFGTQRIGGWWYYYFVGYAVKEPLSWLLLLVLSLPLVMLGKLRGCAWREALALWIPAAAIVVLVSSQTNMSRHLRYALPALPFLFVWTSQYAIKLGETRGAARWLVGLAIVWFVSSSVYYSPHFLSYFNETVGGPAGGHRALASSNLDWGQDLLYLKEWMEEHPEAAGMRIAYFGCFDPHVLGIQYETPEPCFEPHDGEYGQRSLGPSPGWYAVSANYVLGSTSPVPNGRGRFVYFGKPAYAYFQLFEPVDRAGYSIWIYHLKPPEIEAVRRELGLPP